MAKQTLIRLYEDSLSVGTCNGRQCGQTIDWYDTLNGKRMPMDHGAVPVKSENERDTNRVIAFFDATDSHWSNCPDSRKF